jgi:hypothetical protein
MDNKINFNKDTSVGFSYYLNSNNPALGQMKKINTFALSAATKIGALDLSGFAAMQAGYAHGGTPATGRVTYHGWSANALAKINTGGGAAKFGFLFVSGDNNNQDGFNNGWQTLDATQTTVSQNSSAIQNTYNEAGSMILLRDLSTTASQTANYMRVPITNIAVAHFGYNAKLTEKFNLDTNVIMAWLPASDYINGYATSATTRTNGSDYLGTEITMQAGYQLYKNLTLKAQVGYMMLGSAYKNISGTAPNTYTPDNPYSTRLMALYSF